VRQHINLGQELAAPDLGTKIKGRRFLKGCMQKKEVTPSKKWRQRNPRNGREGRIGGFWGKKGGGGMARHVWEKDQLENIAGADKKEGSRDGHTRRMSFWGPHR